MPAVLLALLLLALTPPAPAATPAFRIAAGAGSFEFVDHQGDPAKRMTIETYLPAGLTAGQAPIVFVMHGHGKDAEGYRDTWIAHADQYRFMVIAPRFDPAQWGGGEYSYASVVGQDGAVQDPAQWSFSIVEHLFDAVKTATGNQSRRYSIYGHSEGGQFVHRLVMLLPEARYARAVAANPGWYTMPAFDVRFPYGLAGAPVTRESLARSFSRDFVLLLGDRDTDPDHPALRKTPRAMAQGATRYARGQTYFKTAGDAAKTMRAPFAWRLQVVPGAAHENSKMSAAAAVLIGR